MLRKIIKEIKSFYWINWGINFRAINSILLNNWIDVASCNIDRNWKCVCVLNINNHLFSFYVIWFNVNANNIKNYLMYASIVYKKYKHFELLLNKKFNKSKLLINPSLKNSVWSFLDLLSKWKEIKSWMRFWKFLVIEINKLNLLYSGDILRDLSLIWDYQRSSLLNELPTLSSKKFKSHLRNFVLDRDISILDNPF